MYGACLFVFNPANYGSNERFLGDMVDAETLKALVELADKITTFGLFLAWVSWLIRENAQLKELVYTDWKRQREEEIEQRAEEKFQKKLSTISANSGI